MRIATTVLPAACLARRGDACAMRSGIALTLTLANGGGRERKSKIGEIVSRKRFNNERINEMSNERQETIADIVAEMRIGDLCAEDTSASRPEYINDFLVSYADRIEAAWKRESEAGAEAAQICGEIGEIIGREATCKKYSQIFGADTVRDIAEEMLNTSMQDITAKVIYGWATRLAACEQSVTICNHLGNAAKMREALSDACYAMFNFLKTQNGGYEEMANALDKAKSALATHPRNCDKYTNYDDALTAFIDDEDSVSCWGMSEWLYAEAKGEADEQK